MPVRERQYPSVESAAGALAMEIERTLHRAIAERGHATLVVSGGRTPVHVFRKLRQGNLDWRQVTVTLTDERWVAPDHPDSNERLVRSELLIGAAAAATFVPLFGGEPSPEEGLSQCEGRLATIEVPFDVVYLGLGEDGHIASLFPGDAALANRHGRCVSVMGTPSRLPRMSLSVAMLTSAKHIYLLYSGARKATVFRKSMDRSSPGELPIRILLEQNEFLLTVLSAP